MRPWLARMVTRLYPPRWRQRYAEEFEAMLELGPGDLGTLLDSAGSRCANTSFRHEEAVWNGTRILLLR